VLSGRCFWLLGGRIGRMNRQQASAIEIREVLRLWLQDLSLLAGGPRCRARA